MLTNHLQKTLSQPVSFRGYGLHSGAHTNLTIYPAAAHEGIVFRLMTNPEQPIVIPALWSQIIPFPLCTRLGSSDIDALLTVEHLLAALAGCGIHAARVDVDGPEIPAMDGSAAAFVRKLLRAGIHSLDVPVRYLRILKPVEVRSNDSVARLEPFNGFEMSFLIDFPDQAIGQQSLTLDLGRGGVVRELCDCRTFCQKADIGHMHTKGLSLGGNLGNAVVVDGRDVLTPGGFRRPDEAVRHKMLDAVGDLALAGHPIVGRYVGYKAGHSLTHQLLFALFEQKDCWEVIECDRETGNKLTGTGVSWQEIPKVA